MTELSAFFPVATLCSLERVRAVLQGVHYEAQGAVAWLQFGAEVQTEVADLVARRLSLLEAEPVRATPKHLARLQGLLADVAAGFDGGFLRTPGRAVWAKHLPEIRQLETLLEQGERALIAALASLRELLELSRGCSEQLEAYLLASDWLSKKAPSVAASRVLARQQALAGSKALLLEHLLLLGQDEARLEDLVHLTRDGVQLRLPAVHALLSSTPDRPSDTQRFLATEKLNELVQLIERKKSWL